MVRRSKDLLADKVQRFALLDKACAEMFGTIVNEPSTLDEVREGIDPSEGIVGDIHLPKSVRPFLPAAHFVGTRHDDALSFRRTIHDRHSIASGIRRLHPFAVDSLPDRNGVACLRDGRGASYRPPWMRRRAVRRIVAGRRHEVFARRGRLACHPLGGIGFVFAAFRVKYRVDYRLVGAIERV